MFSLPGVGVLVGGAAVEIVEAERVAGEVGRHPVQNDPDARLVKLVDEILQVVRRTKAAGGGIVARTLVAPGGIQRMLRDREQLHMGEAHLLDVWGQVGRDIPVAEELPLAGAPPGA